MNAKDLMIGDWVFNEIPCYVTAIYHNGTIDCQGDNQSISTDSVDPIPLTAEILEKNGFYEAWDGSWYRDGSDLIIDDDNGLYLGISLLSIRLDYVHELQHVLRLCGIDKEIKL